jgi:hypothetical protein
MGNFAIEFILASMARRSIEGILQGAWWIRPLSHTLRARTRSGEGLQGIACYAICFSPVKALGAKGGQAGLGLGLEGNSQAALRA